jgi:hypothetical protein
MELRRAAGPYTDQKEIVDGTLTLWKKDYGRAGLDTRIDIHSPRNACIVDGGVGGGKTAIGVSILKGLNEWLSGLKDDKSNLPSLVITRSNCVFQWVEEIEHWWTQGITLLMAGNGEEVKSWLDLWDYVHPKIIVLNYDKASDYQEILRQRGPYLCVILDEVHAIAYEDTQRNQAIDSLVSYYRIGLSGTIVRREPDSVYGILNWAQPGKYTSRTVAATPPTACKECRWKDEAPGWYKWHKNKGCQAVHERTPHCPLYIQNAEDASQGFCAWAAKELHGKPEHQHYYHGYSPEWGTKADFAEDCENDLSGMRRRMYEDTHLVWKLDTSKIPGFPEVFPKRVDCVMSDTQSKFYRQAECGLVTWLEENGEWGQKDVMNVLAQITMLRKIATLPPAIVQEQLRGSEKYPWLKGIQIPKDMEGCKQTWIEDFFNTGDYFQNGDKVILFSQWTLVTNDLYHRISKLLKERGQYAIHIYGGMKDFAGAQLAFNSDDSCSVAICSPAGSEGINLHRGLIGRDGQMHTIHVDCGWTPMEMVQRSGRARRPGGKSHNAFFTIAKTHDGKGTIDSEMFDRVSHRASMSDMMTGSNLSELFDFGSRDDVLGLLKH